MREKYLSNFKILKSVINFIWKKKIKKYFNKNYFKIKCSHKLFQKLNKFTYTLIFLFKTFSFIRFETLNHLKFYVFFI